MSTLEEPGARRPPSGEARRSDVLRASPPMFRTPLIDRFTRVHPAVPLVLFAPAIVLLVLAADHHGASTTALVAFAVGGFVLWGLVEYWTHRVAFHFEPEEGLGARLHWMVHGVHHDHPNDPLRLVMPPAVSVPGLTLFVLAFVGLLGTADGLALGAGFVLGYLVYDTTHHHLHHRRPRTRVGRWLRELHMRHHFQDDTRGFGISSPWWDSVFRTTPDRAGRDAERPRD
ncbi:sterol desaturase family protein [Patulibacter brassicae]|uniref:Sterol desaturase family protein n=1 Tax=Patulibacter brassicae TaxID=1705717 RepID=A0ABU4VGB9_9ACTN|nr:sterol desaturase family protein [Patulibacter brassicae]MDX8150867.1 sterol desaturase family protein [Patulibacter brassicae]